jgi:hypothetical protein
MIPDGQKVDIAVVDEADHVYAVKAVEKETADE